MAAKAEKCQSFVIFKGKVMRRILKIGGKDITPTQDKPVKSHGKNIKQKSVRKEDQRGGK